MVFAFSRLHMATASLKRTYRHICKQARKCKHTYGIFKPHMESGAEKSIRYYYILLYLYIYINIVIYIYILLLYDQISISTFKLGNFTSESENSATAAGTQKWRDSTPLTPGHAGIGQSSQFFQPLHYQRLPLPRCQPSFPVGECREIFWKLQPI